jgi:hypothetical protein
MLFAVLRQQKTTPARATPETRSPPKCNPYLVGVLVNPLDPREHIQSVRRLFGALSTEHAAPGRRHNARDLTCGQFGTATALIKKTTSVPQEQVAPFGVDLAVRLVRRGHKSSVINSFRRRINRSRQLQRLLLGSGCTVTPLFGQKVALGALLFLLRMFIPHSYLFSNNRDLGLDIYRC